MTKKLLNKMATYLVRKADWRHIKIKEAVTSLKLIIL